MANPVAVPAELRRSWALTAVPAALLLGVLAWPGVQDVDDVAPSEVPQQVEQAPRSGGGKGADLRARGRQGTGTGRSPLPAPAPPRTAATAPRETPSPTATPTPVATATAPDAADPTPGPTTLPECVRRLLDELSC